MTKFNSKVTLAAMRSCALFIFIFISLQLNSQEQIDSLNTVVKEAQDLRNRIEARFALYDAYVSQREFDLGEEQLVLAEMEANTTGESDLIAKSYLKLGQLRSKQERGVESIEYFNKALIIPDGLTPYGYFKAHNGMGIIYMVFDDHKSSLFHFQRAATYVHEAEIESGRKLSYIHNNIGIAYTNLGYLDSAQESHSNCLQLRTENEDTLGRAQSLMNIGTLFYEKGMYDSSLHYFEIANEIRHNSPKTPISGLIESDLNVGKALVALKQYGRAEGVLLKGLKEAEEIGYYNIAGRAMKDLVKLYSETGNYKKAFQYSQEYHTYKDSAFNYEKKEELIRLNAMRDYEARALRDSITYAEQAKMDAMALEKEHELQKEKDKANFAIQIGLGIAVLLMLGIVVLVLRNLKSKKQAAEEIQAQKIEVEKQRDIAKDQSTKLADINREITDSIVYAERIQSSIMPSKDAVSKMLGDHFVYYRPKAIVAGDFYWVHESHDRIYFSAADCTGHGVPGALVSIVCSNALTRAVEEYALQDPGQVLDKASELVIEAFSKNDQLVKDGMDLSLCCWIKNENRLEYAGANNSIYIIREKNEDIVDEKVVQNATHFVEEVKANKQPVGYSEIRVPFETQTIDLRKGDTVYSFTDGYPDQFGGDKGKKFKYKSLKQLLLDNTSQSMNAQASILEERFVQWMGDLEQVDDVCIIGVRV